VQCWSDVCCSKNSRSNGKHWPVAGRQWRLVLVFINDAYAYGKLNFRKILWYQYFNLLLETHVWFLGGSQRYFILFVWCLSFFYYGLLATLVTGPALASAGPKARPGRGALLRNDVMLPSCSVNLAMTFLIKMF